jgi:hypothetical protein
MEKIIDLPVRLPRIRDDTLNGYLERLLDVGTRTERPTIEVTIPHQRDGAADAASPATQASVQLQSATAAATPAAPIANASSIMTHTTTDAAPTSAAAAIDVRERIEELEDLRAVRSALRAAIRALPQRNPRQTKAFLNLWRF